MHDIHYSLFSVCITGKVAIQAKYTLTRAMLTLRLGKVYYVQVKYILPCRLSPCQFLTRASTFPNKLRGLVPHYG